MKNIVLLALVCTHWLYAQAIVFVHIGPTLPGYAIDAIKQARLFNPNIPIYLVANGSALQSRSEIPAVCVATESLPPEKNHDLYNRISRNRGFWRFTTERFFYVYELMKKYGLSEVFHLENDNLLYANVDEILPTLRKYYSNQLGVTFDHDHRGIAGFIYIANIAPLEQFLNFIVRTPHINDMEQLGRFKNNKGPVDHLPITAPCYAADHPMISPHGHQGSHPELFSRHYDELRVIFDAAAMGQYLGGIDPIHGPVRPGFISESCVVNPSYFDYEWIKDQEGRKIPYAIYNGEKIKIANLHIHCKDLKKYSSL